MPDTKNNILNFEKYKTDEISGVNMVSATPAWQKLIDEREFIQKGTLLIVNGCNMFDAVFAAGAGFNVTLLDLSSSNRNFLEELLSAYPEIKFIGTELFSSGFKSDAKFDFVYETAYSLINPNERENYLEHLSKLVKPGGRLITIFKLPGKKIGNGSIKISPVHFHKDMNNFMSLEFSSKYPISTSGGNETEVLQVYIKPNSKG